MSGTVRSVDVTWATPSPSVTRWPASTPPSSKQASAKPSRRWPSAQLTLNVALSGEDPSTSGAGGLAGGAAAVGVSTSGDVVFEFATAGVDAYTYVLASTSDDVAAARQAVARRAERRHDRGQHAPLPSEMPRCRSAPPSTSRSTPTIPRARSARSARRSARARRRSNDLMAAQDAVTAAQDAAQDGGRHARRPARCVGGRAGDERAHDDDTGTDHHDSSAYDDDAARPRRPSTTPRSTTASTVPTAGSPGGGAPSGGAPSERRGASGGGSLSPAARQSLRKSAKPTAAELIAYQVAYDAAAQSVEAAQQAIGQATIVSPIAGTVIAVDLAVGDDRHRGVRHADDRRARRRRLRGHAVDQRRRHRPDRRRPTG